MAQPFDSIRPLCTIVIDCNQLQIYDPQSTESFSVVNRAEPTFVVQGRDFSPESQFFVFSQNPVGHSPSVTLSASSIVGMKQEQTPSGDINEKPKSLFEYVVIGIVVLVALVLCMSCYLLVVSKRRCVLRC